jgi:ribose transport system substrate-binding protein
MITTTTGRVKTAAVVALSLTMALTSCSRTPSSSGGENSDLSLTFANYTEAGPVFHVITTTLQEQLQAAKNAPEVKFFDNNGNPETMLTNARLMVQAKPDIIIEYPVAENAVGVRNIFSKAEIPCIAVNLPLDGCSFINIDNDAMGLSAGELAAREMKQRGWDPQSITVLLGQNATAGPSVNGNLLTFAPRFSELGGLPPVSASDITPDKTQINANIVQFDGKSDQDISFNAVRSLLAGIPAARNLVLYTVNDDETLGAYRAIKDANRTNVIVIGHGGGRTDSLQLLRDDPNWVGQDVFYSQYWGEYLIAMAQAIQAGQTPPETTFLPSITIDKAGLNKYFDTNTFEAKKLPPLTPESEYLKKGGFLQEVGNIEGITS